MKKTIKFRNEEMELVKVTIEFRKINEEYKSKDTLEKYHCDLQLSFYGEMGGSSGQIVDIINPRTESQKELVRLWERYHLNGMSAGTTKQNKLIKKCRRGDYSDMPKSVQQDVEIIFKQLDKISAYDAQLYLLRVKDVDIDRGYKYGSGWLYEQLPEDIEETIDDLLEAIEEEEDELSEKLEAVFDMGSSDFKPTAEIISKVMELRDCDKDEAVRFIALGMYLECTFGDLDYDFQEESDNCYSAMGRWYYVGTSDELEEIAEEMMDDPCYIDCWKSAVAEGSCLDSFKDWKEDVLRYDGWASIINTFDGSYEEYCVGNEFICVSRI